MTTSLEEALSDQSEEALEEIIRKERIAAARRIRELEARVERAQARLRGARATIRALARRLRDAKGEARDLERRALLAEEELDEIRDNYSEGAAHGH